MSILRLLDLSTFIHAGNISESKQLQGDLVKTDKNYFTPTMFVGGVSFIFNTIYEHMHNSDIVFCADRKPMFRIKINPNYKANHIFSERVQKQKDLAEHVLTDCGFEVVYYDDFEADDVIYSLKERRGKRYDEVYIHTSDSDIFMNVATNVHIAPVKSTDIAVTMSNYSTSFGKGVNMRYNMCNILKMIEGDRGDNYKGVTDSRIANKLYTIADGFKDSLGNTEAMASLINAICPEAYDQFCLAYPQMLPVDFNEYYHVNQAKLNAWGYVLMNSNYKNVDLTQISEELKEIKIYCNNLLNGSNVEEAEVIEEIPEIPEYTGDLPFNNGM